MKQPITIDLAWSSRAFNIGLTIGATLGMLFAAVLATIIFN